MKRVVIIGAKVFVGLYLVENPYICCDNARIQGMVKWYGEGGNG